VTAKFGLCGAATIVAGQGDTLTIRVDGSTVDLLPDDPDAVAVDGVTMSAAAALEMHRADVDSGRDPDEWSVVGQALLALHAIASTESWSANAEVARAATAAAARNGSVPLVGSLLLSSEAWCTVIAYSAAVGTAAIIGGACELGIDETVPRKITTGLEKGISLSERAALARHAKQAQKLRKKARHAFERASNMAGKLALRAGASLSSACATKMKDAVDTVLAGPRCG
jgi:hypothetical protein